MSIVRSPRSVRFNRVLLVAIVGLVTWWLTASSIWADTTYSLLLSNAPDRSGPVALQGQTVAGDIYVFTGPDTDVSHVTFHVDDPAMAGTPFRTENNAPFDLGGGSAGTAFPFSTLGLPNGDHDVTASLATSTGAQVVSATFTVNNAVPDYSLQLSASPDRSAPVALDGQTVSGDIHVFTSPDTDVSQVKFYINDPALAGDSFRTENSAPFDLAGGASNGSALPFSTLGLPDGENSITAALATSAGTQVTTATFTVNNAGPGEPGDPDGCAPELLERTFDQVVADLLAAYAAGDWAVYACNYHPDAFVIDDQGLMIGRAEIADSAESLDNLFCGTDHDVNEDNYFRNVARILFELDGGWVVIPDGIFTFNIEGGQILSQTTHALIEFTGPPPEGGSCPNEDAD